MTQPLEKHGRFFDVWSQFYRRSPLGRGLQRVQGLAIDRLKLLPGQRVLDLGCGPGDGATHLARFGAVPIGLDYSRGMLEQAKGATSLQGRLLRGDASHLPFCDGAFDAIVCTNSFHHYPDHRAALKEMHRVLKVGGRLALVDPRRDNVFGWGAIDVVEKVVFRLHEVRIFTISQWKVLLEEAGFGRTRVERGPLWDPFAWVEVFVEAVKT